MKSGEVMLMHEDFPTWVGEFELGEDVDAREKCWGGVVAFVNDADSDDVEGLVRLAYNTRQKAQTSFLEKFRTALQDANPESVVPRNDREMQVLAGCSLVVLLGSDDTGLAALVALAITTASAAGGRKHKLPMDIAGLAENALLRLSESNSQRPDLSKYNIKLPALSLDPAAFPAAFTAITSALKTISTNQNLANIATRTIVNQQDEELQMLWWLIGGRSIDVACAFNKVGKKFQPLLFAKELADQTEVLPGPGSIKGLLSRAGLKDAGKLELQDAVNNAKTVWLSSLVEEIEPSPITQPIHFAIKRQLETGAGEAWIAGWAATTELNAKLSFSPLEFGNLFYRERLLELFLGE